MDVLHVEPVDDLIEHDTSPRAHDLFNDDCICGPHVEFGDGWTMIVHHSLDGRELTE